MSSQYRVPKLSDREIVDALMRVRAQLPEFGLAVSIDVPTRSGVDVSNEQQRTGLKYLFDADSQVATVLRLHNKHGNAALLRRQTEQITDQLTIEGEWINRSQQERPNEFLPLYVRFISLIRSELKIADTEATFNGHGDNEWNRYRNAQQGVINSLESAAQSLIVKTADRNAELDRQRAERFEKLETELRGELQVEREKFQKEIAQKREALAAEEKVLADRLAAFETKEAHYVARQKQGEQLKQVQDWLVKWNLTEGTTRKRLPITAGYVAGILGSGWLAFYSLHHSYALLQTAADLSKIVWWQWVALMAKAFFPLATCVTFIIYFIRWSSAWARQHADEEFRNRALLIDIGRSGWLIEVVRDAQQRNGEIPQALLTELSRNLFSYSASADVDLHPQAISDLLLQGLTSIRVKSPDGSEIEASRGKK